MARGAPRDSHRPPLAAILWCEGLHCEARIRDLLRDTGLSLYDLTRATFSYPGWLRDALRGEGHDLDQKAAAFMAQRARHPTKPCLSDYVQHREERLSEIKAERRESKQLFSGFAYGGGRRHIEKWCAKNHVDKDSFRLSWRTS